MNRDFSVDVIDGEGDQTHFEGRNCKVIQKTLSTRAGIGPVDEVIKCEKVTLSEKETEIDL